MRRNAMTRIMTVLYAVWFVVALGAQTAQPCPAHDAMSFAGAPMAGMPMTGAMAGMATPHDASHAPAHHGSSHDDGAQHACTCVGCCCVTALDLAGARMVQVPESRIVVAALVAPGARCRPAASRQARRLPFPNGPPEASTATA